jgi:hypothetical protein
VAAVLRVMGLGAERRFEIYQSYNLCKTLALLTGCRKAVATAWVPCAATVAV